MGAPNMMQAVVFVVLVTLGASHGIEPMSPERWEQAKANWNATMTAYHKGQYSAQQGSCSSDIRSSFPACMQYAPDWCWATGIAELASFFKPEEFPEKGNDCHHLECMIAGYKRDASNPAACCNGTKFCASDQKCCKAKVLGFPTCEGTCGFFGKEVDDYACRYDQCGAIGGNEDDIVNAIRRLTGKEYANKTDGPLSQDQINTILNKGHPVIMVVMWTYGGGHAVTLGGCAPPKASGGNTTYYLHDPLHKAGVYQELTYDQIADYKPPWDKTLDGYWTYTFWLSGDLEAAAEEILV